MGKNRKTRTVQSTEYDPTFQSNKRSLFNQAEAELSKGFQRYGGDRFAGFNTDQEGGFDAVRGLQGGIDFSEARGLLAGGTPITPEQVRAQNISAENFTDRDINAYLNPATDQIVNRTLSDLDRARTITQQSIADKAQAAGAFGGSRLGVLEAENNRNFFDRSAAAAGDLRGTAFDRASGLLVGDLNRGLQAQMSNQNAGLRAGIANQQAGLQAGALNNQDRIARAGLLGSFASQGFDSRARAAQGLLGIGNQQQSLEQARRDFDFDEFDQDRNFRLRGLGFLSGLNATGPINSTTRTVGTPPQQGSRFGSALGGAATGFAAGGGPWGAAGGFLTGLFGGA